MSKSTSRYGKIKYILRSAIEVNPKPSVVLVAEWKFFNKIANFLYGNSYFNLSDKVRLELHECINNVPSQSVNRLKLIQAKLI